MTIPARGTHFDTSWPAIAGTLALHAAAYLLLAFATPEGPPKPECGNGRIEPPEICDDGNTLDGDGCSARCTLELELREVEVVEPKQPEPPPPKPLEPVEPPPPPDPVEPPPQPKPPKSKPPKPRPRPKQPPPPSDTPPAPPPADAAAPPPVFELPSDQTTGSSSSGVTVVAGTQTVIGETGGVRGGKRGGTPGGTGTTVGGVGVRPSPDNGTSRSWAPKSELYLKTLPQVVQVPKLRCPAADELGLRGEVKLKVQVWRDGKIRRVKIVKSMGQGCDEIAVRALKRAKFKPAVGSDGKAVDYELIYTYEYKPIND